MRYLVHRQAGKMALPSEVYTQMQVFTDINIIHKFLPLYIDPRPLQLAPCCWISSPSETAGRRLELGQAADRSGPFAIETCLTADRPLPLKIGREEGREEGRKERKVSSPQQRKRGHRHIYFQS